MKKLSLLLVAVVALSPFAAMSATNDLRQQTAGDAPKAVKVLPPSPAYVCATKAKEAKLEGVSLKVFMARCLQSKNPRQFK